LKPLLAKLVRDEEGAGDEVADRVGGVHCFPSQRAVS